MGVDWRALERWEEDNKSVSILVLDPESLRQDMSYFIPFDDEKQDDFIMYADKISDDMIQGAMLHAQESFDWSDAQDELNNLAFEYLVENLSSKVKVQKGNFYDDVTQQFYKWDELTALYEARREKIAMNNQMELNFIGEKDASKI